MSSPAQNSSLQVQQEVGDLFEDIRVKFLEMEETIKVQHEQIRGLKEETQRLKAELKEMIEARKK